MFVWELSKFSETTVKYSILVPYYKRIGHLHNSFISFIFHYATRNDYEIIIAEDLKNVQNKEDHNSLLNTISKFNDRINIIHSTVSVKTWNPVLGFNVAANKASGEYFIITNPECFHATNILKGLDEEFKKDPNSYVICSSRNYKGCNFFIDNYDDLGGREAEWYQHSVYRNANFHFCTAISKKNWYKIGGFDEKYAQGIAYDDADFRNSVYKAQLPVKVRNDLFTIHIDHNSFPSPPNAQKLVNKNRITYQKKWEGK